MSLIKVSGKMLAVIYTKIFLFSNYKGSPVSANHLIPLNPISLKEIDSFFVMYLKEWAV